MSFVIFIIAFACYLIVGAIVCGMYYRFYDMDTGTKIVYTFCYPLVIVADIILILCRALYKVFLKPISLTFDTLFYYGYTAAEVFEKNKRKKNRRKAK